MLSAWWCMGFRFKLLLSQLLNSPELCVCWPCVQLPSLPALSSLIMACCFGGFFCEGLMRRLAPHLVTEKSPKLQHDSHEKYRHVLFSDFTWLSHFHMWTLHMLLFFMFHMIFSSHMNHLFDSLMFNRLILPYILFKWFVYSHKFFFLHISFIIMTWFIFHIRFFKNDSILWSSHSFHLNHFYIWVIYFHVWHSRVFLVTWHVFVCTFSHMDFARFYFSTWFSPHMNHLFDSFTVCSTDSFFFIIILWFLYDSFIFTFFFTFYSYWHDSFFHIRFFTNDSFFDSFMFTSFFSRVIFTHDSFNFTWIFSHMIHFSTDLFLPISFIFTWFFFSPHIMFTHDSFIFTWIIFMWFFSLTWFLFIIIISHFHLFHSHE